MFSLSHDLLHCRQLYMDTDTFLMLLMTLQVHWVSAIIVLHIKLK